jgi:hypothetical protein
MNLVFPKIAKRDQISLKRYFLLIFTANVPEGGTEKLLWPIIAADSK